MRFTETSLDGVLIVDIDPLRDERGLFARTFDRDEFAAHGLAVELVQASVSYNEQAGTLRGMHYQAEPHGENKLVRCVRGTIFDVAIDLASRRWFGLELSAESRRALYVPRGFAHGFLTLSDSAEVLYHMDAPFVPGTGRGVRWDDPAFGIDWPRRPVVISERDATYPDLAA
jgi:dTDP-4-dehydrorhamnose 3,5-epimerase